MRSWFPLRGTSRSLPSRLRGGGLEGGTFQRSQNAETGGVGGARSGRFPCDDRGFLLDQSALRSASLAAASSRLR